MERNQFIDSLKGFAIILVVLGHSLEKFGYNDSLVHNLIYAFHMPLFFVISGYLSANPNIKKRFTGLMVPFFIWLIIYYPLGGHASFVLEDQHLGSFTHYIVSSIKNPAIGMWFLWALFLCNCYLTLFKNNNYFLVLGTMLLVVFPSGSTVLGFLYLKANLVFFVTGYLISKYKPIVRTPYLAYTFLIFPLLLQFQAPSNVPTFLYLIPHHLLQSVVSAVYFYLLAMSGIGYSLVIAKLTTNRIFSLIGNHTLFIYAAHWMFLYLSVPIAVVCGITIPLILSLLWQKAPAATEYLHKFLTQHRGYDTCKFK